MDGQISRFPAQRVIQGLKSHSNTVRISEDSSEEVDSSCDISASTELELKSTVKAELLQSQVRTMVAEQYQRLAECGGNREVGKADKGRKEADKARMRRTHKESELRKLVEVERQLELAADQRNSKETSESLIESLQNCTNLL